MALTPATQSLAKLQALDRDQRRTLRTTLFSNLDGLFAFHSSAEDAQYPIKELGGDLDIPDLVEMGEHRCYAKVSARGARLPVFSVELDPPPAGDAALAERLAAESAARYGRAAAKIGADLDAALERVRLNRAKAERSRGSKEQYGNEERRPGNGRGGAMPSRGRNDGRPSRGAKAASAPARPEQAAGGSADSGAAHVEALPPAPPSGVIFHQATLFMHAGETGADIMEDDEDVDVVHRGADDDEVIDEREREEWDTAESANWPKVPPPGPPRSRGGRR